MATSQSAKSVRGAGLILALVTLILFTDLLNYDLVVPILPEYARAWNLTESTLGLLFGSYALALLLTLPLSSWLCDRLGAVRALQFSTAVLLLSQVLYASANGPALLFVARMLQGAAGGAVLTAGLVLIALVYPPDQRGRAMGTAMGGMSLGALFGPPLGGWLYTWGGPRCPFLLTPCWTLVLWLLLLRLPASLARAPSQERRRLPRSGWGDYLPLFSAVVLGMAFLSGLELTLPVHLKEKFCASPEHTGMLFGLATLVYGLSAPLAGWAADRWGGGRVMLGGLTASVLSLPLIALPSSWAGEAIVLVVFAVVCAFLMSPALPEIAAICDRHENVSFGTAYAVFNLADALGMLLGPVVGGVLKPVIGFGLTLVVFSGAAALLLPLVLRHVCAGRSSARGDAPVGSGEPKAA